MTDETTDTAGSTGETSPGPGAQGGTTGEQAPSSNPGVTADQLRAIIGEAMAPLADRLGHLENQEAARRRVTQKAQKAQKQETTGQAQNGGGDLESMREQLEAQQREMKALKDAEAARVEAEQKATLRKALEKAIGKEGANYVGTSVLFNEVERHAKIGTLGDPIWDDGKQTKPLAQAVADIAADNPIFQKPMSGEGTGSGEGRQLPAATINRDGQEREVTMQDVADPSKVTDEDIRKMAQAVVNDHHVNQFRK